jgi:hypothetical protein
VLSSSNGLCKRDCASEDCERLARILQGVDAIAETLIFRG